MDSAQENVNTVTEVDLEWLIVRAHANPMLKRALLELRSYRRQRARGVLNSGVGKVQRALDLIQEVSEPLSSVTLDITNSQQYAPSVCEKLGKVLLGVREARDALLHALSEGNEPPERPVGQCHWEDHVVLVPEAGAPRRLLTIDRLFQLFEDRLERRERAGV